MSNNKTEPFRSENQRLFSQHNWLAANAGESIRDVVEYPLFTDASIKSEYKTDRTPYSFLNTVPLSGRQGEVNAHIIARVKRHFDYQLPAKSDKDETAYHGGALVDELAALVSVCLGARIKAGGECRRFDIEEDPYGRPTAYNEKAIPSLNVPPSMMVEIKPSIFLDTRNYVLPNVVGEKSLKELSLLSSITKLSHSQYVSLVRACRFYQDALWVAESEPNLAWIMFVSALETAANNVAESSGAAEERLKQSKPELAKMLEKAGGEELVKDVADQIQNSLGATKKFIDFVLKFLPPEPSNRPNDEHCKIQWDRRELKKCILPRIYEYRSRALHGGIPFPAPMLDPAWQVSGSIFSEKPMMGLASHALGGTWLPQDAPINLHCFHYIVREALIAWWKSMGQSKGSIDKY